MSARWRCFGSFACPDRGSPFLLALTPVQEILVELVTRHGMLRNTQGSAWGLTQEVIRLLPDACGNSRVK